MISMSRTVLVLSSGKFLTCFSGCLHLRNEAPVQVLVRGGGGGGCLHALVRSNNPTCKHIDVFAFKIARSPQNT